MNETLALAQYAWTKRRLVTTGLMAGLGISLLMVVAGWLSLPVARGEPAPATSWQVNALASVSILTIGCLMYSVILLDFGRDSSLLDRRTGYDGWLLRLPISDWKLTAIPIALLTLWIALVWMAFVFAFQLLAAHRLPIVAQTLALSSCAIFVRALAWMPQSGSWQRLAAFVCSIPILYGASVGCLIVHQEASQWMPLATVASGVAYVAASLYSFRCVKLARVSAYQQCVAARPLEAQPTIPTLPARIRHWFVPRPTSVAGDALRWHEYSKAWANRWWLTGTMLMLTLLVLLILPPGGAVIGSLILLVYVGSTTASTLLDRPVWGCRSSLPTYLAAGPISSRALAWTRLRVVAETFLKFFVLMSLLLCVNLVWQQNRDIVGRWWAQYLSPDYRFAPLRIAATIWFAVPIAGLGIALRSATANLYGRMAFMLAVQLSIVIAWIACLSVFLAWFFEQSQWEEVERSVRNWLTWIPTLLAIGLLIKSASVVLAIAMARRKVVPERSMVAKIVALWGLAVVSIGTTFWQLWPGEEVGYAVWLMGTAVALPLASLFAAPVAVDANRHRRVPIARLRRALPKRRLPT